MRLWAARRCVVCVIILVPHICGAAQGGTPGGTQSANRARLKTHIQRHALAPQAPIDVRRLKQDVEATRVARALAHLAARDFASAGDALEGCKGPAASLVRARLALAAGDGQGAEAALDKATDPALAPLVNMERGKVALALGQPGRAAAFFEPVVARGGALGRAAVLPWAQGLLAADPAHLVDQVPRLLALLQGELNDGAQDSTSRSTLLELGAQAHDTLGHVAGATALRLRRYLEEPNARDAPQEAPFGASVDPSQAIGRIELLVAAHGSTAALAALAQFDAQYPAASQTRDVSCRRHFAFGLAARKLHRYGEAERAMAFVRARCGHDAQLVRRAAYTEAKVVNIQDGMRALPLIDAFVEQNPNHSMTDDVLFWAGDSHQRRGHIEEAEGYYERILKLPTPDDQCEEAAFRMAWLACGSHKPQLALRRLAMALAGRCAKSADGSARAHYWMGRIQEGEGQRPMAQASYRRSILARPMGYYAQQASLRLMQLLPAAKRRAYLKELSPSTHGGPEGLCPAHLADEPEFLAGLGYLRQGLAQDAAAAFAALPTQGQIASRGGHVVLNRCSPAQAALLLVQLRFAAGDYKGGLSQLLRQFDAILLGPDQPGAAKVWQAAYPLAFRPILSAAEREQDVPPWLLQALAREESRFDGQVTSWAEAYGLTQLTLGAAQTAGRRLVPKVVVSHKEALFDTALNARLGGALLGQLGKRYRGFWPLALAAYNGGQRNSDAWWQRFGGADFAGMGEDMSVRETRTYVQRVMETYGIYRWLYEGGLPGEVLPARVPLQKANMNHK